MKFLLLILWLGLVALAAARTCDQRPNSPIGTCAFVGGEFSDAQPRSGSQYDYRYICYAGFDTTAACAQFPSSYRKYCNCGPDKTSLIDTYPVQLRWGAPSNSQPAPVHYPSGFGWRGAQGVAVPQPGRLFYLGEAAHFNYVITSGALSTWTMTLVVVFDVQGRPEQTVRFELDLEMDETSNFCTGAGCENAAFWGNKGPNDPDIWPACKNCGYSSSSIARRLNTCSASSDWCCPYVTISEYIVDPPGPDNSYTAAGPCSDRVWTLTRFAQSIPIDIGDGFEYTVSFAGFTAPGSPQTPVDYFISQETRQTPAEIWGSLVRNCPSTESCPSPAVLQLNEAGDACVCKCPASYTCPAGQELDATCQCVCKNTGQCGPCGRPVLSGNGCQCQCNTDPSCCGTGSRQVASGPKCQCACPADVCTPPKTLTDPNAITCPCKCPDCTGRQVLVDGNTCRCACPASACVAPKVVSNPNDPSCPCACPTTTCANTNHVVDPSTCKCACPTPLATCTSPKQFNPNTCQCECPVGCPAGQIQQSDCSCKCPTSSCKAPKVLAGDGSSNPNCDCICPASFCSKPGSSVVDPRTAGACECTCPSTYCANGGTLVNPNAPEGSCECTCRDCAGHWAPDEQCNCNVCPPAPPTGSGAANWDQYCSQQLGNGNVWDVATCSCICPQGVSCGCVCVPKQSDCWTQAADSCVTGGPSSCTPTPTNQGKSCGAQASNVCLNPQCDTSGNCVFHPLDCQPTLDALGDDAQCFTVACDPTNGCTTTFHDAQSCQVDLGNVLAGGSSPVATRAQCYYTQCRNNKCEAIFNATAKCSLSYAAKDRPCVEFACRGDDATGDCVASLAADATCSLDLATIIPADHDPHCYVSQCAQDRGDGQPGCVAVPADGITCQAAGTENYDEVCYSSVCSSGKCVVKLHNDDPCALTQVPQCHVAQCMAGTCSAVMEPTSTCALDLSSYGESAQCYAAECVAAKGGCAAVFQDGNNCTLKGLAAVVGAANVPCYTSVCTGDKCAPTPLPDGTRCFEPAISPPEGGDKQCYIPYCVAGTCGWSPAPGLSCDDFDPCSLAPNTTDPVSGRPSDVCVVDPDNSTVVVCHGTANTCDLDRLAQENETMTRCLETQSQEQCQKQLSDKLRDKRNCTQVCQPVSTSYYCLDPCAVKASGRQSDAVAIALGTIGGVCVFGLAAIVLIFAYVKWGHQYLVGLFNVDAQIAAAQDSPLYADPGAAGTSQLYEGSA